MKELPFFLSLWIFILFSAASCVDSGLDSNTSITYTVSDFSRLNLEVIGEVIYEQADSSYLNVSGSSTLIEALKVSDSKGELSIELKNKRKFSGGKKELVIRVGSLHLQSINSKSIGTLHLRNYFEGDKLNITNKGIGNIIIDDCHVRTFDLTSKSVGVIEVKGTSDEAFIHSEGLGDIDCSEFKTKNTKVVSKGTGDLSVNAQNSIDISITGIGNVNYYGNPEEVKTDISGIGKARKMDR